MQTEKGERDEKAKNNTDSQLYSAFYISFSSIYSNSLTMTVVREAVVSGKVILFSTLRRILEITGKLFLDRQRLKL